MCDCPTVEDFILAFDLSEATDLTTDCDSCIPEVDRVKLQSVITDACNYLDAIIFSMCDSRAVFLLMQSRRLILDIARYNADWLKSRDTVTERYQNALKIIDSAKNISCNQTVDCGLAKIRFNYVCKSNVKVTYQSSCCKNSIYSDKSLKHRKGIF